MPDRPDYRFTLANERTFLAWTRTALALLAGGVAVLTLVPEFAVAGTRRGLGVALLLFAAFVSAVSYRRWQRIEVAMQRGEPIPLAGLSRLVAGGVGVVALATVVLVLVA